MILKKPYKNITDTMLHVKAQIVDSIDFAFETIPNEIQTPEQLFAWLKSKVVFEDDEESVEHLRTMQSLAENNWRGDCDCFTITSVACMIAKNWDNVFIDLVGRKKTYPVHIYSEIIWQGQREVFDLTNPKFNFERPGYKYRQRLPARWRTWSATPVIPSR